MDNFEEEIVYTIPPNYTDSGKILGGMISPRNLIEAILLVLGLGFLELKVIPMDETTRIVVMALTLLPLFFVAIIGIDGDSLIQYIKHVGSFFIHKRKLKRREVIRDETQ